MGIAERREREKRQIRQQILDAAMELFVEEGYGNVSIRKIADKIEYSPATIYLYFKDKDEILYHLHEEGFRELLKRQQTALSIQNPRERLQKLGEIYISFALEKPEYYDLMFIMNAPIRKIEGEWGCGLDAFETLRTAVKDCIEAGFIKAENVEIASVAMWSFVHGFASLYIRDRLQMIPQDQLSHISRGLLDFFRDNA